MKCDYNAGMPDTYFVNKDNSGSFCKTNGVLFEKGEKPRGLVMEFPGLGGNSCLGGTQDLGNYIGEPGPYLASKGILLAYMFTGPWSWMNPGAVRLTDLTVGAIFEKYGLDRSIRPVAAGGSMGGLGALMWSAGSHYNVKACAAHCPGVDMLSTFWHREDFSRTLFDAVGSLDMSIEDGLKSVSPVYNIDRLPDIPYYITCDGEDECFDREETERFAAAMKASGKNVRYVCFEGAAHGEFSPPEERNRYWDFIIDNALL